MRSIVDELDFSDAVDYHYNKFPPNRINEGQLLQPLSQASAAIARYDQMLKGMHNSEILLAPLGAQEAVISSRIEGTISTLDEVLRYEADQELDVKSKDHDHRIQTIEVALYKRAMIGAQGQLEQGAQLSSWLIKATHADLLSLGPRASKNPGQFKTEQNYLVDQPKRKVLFKPIAPEFLNDGLERLFDFMNSPGTEILMRTAISHLEFEALHPFNDGNGRIGRMLITLMLWQHGTISAPHFYVSSYFEANREEYIDRMRDVSRSGAWTEWIKFFLNGLETQANYNLETVEKISALYEDMKKRFVEALSSKWSISALDFMFANPIFRNNTFTKRAGIPGPTASKFVRKLVEADLLLQILPSAGQRPAMYAFEPLLEIVRS